MKQRHYIYAILLTFPLFFISGCDDAMQTKSNSNNVQLDESGVKNAVMEALQQDDLFARSKISVMSSNGQITLNGTAASAQDKNRATEIARNITGVKSVQNNLQVTALDESN